MTVVSAVEPVLNEKGEALDKDGEVVDSSKRAKKDQVEAHEEVYYYLLHWGLTYQILYDRNIPYPITYTVGICQHIKTGVIKLFTPDKLTVIGKEQK